MDMDPGQDHQSLTLEPLLGGPSGQVPSVPGGSRGRTLGLYHLLAAEKELSSGWAQLKPRNSHEVEKDGTLETLSPWIQL